MNIRINPAPANISAYTHVHTQQNWKSYALKDNNIWFCIELCFLTLEWKKLKRLQCQKRGFSNRDEVSLKSTTFGSGHAVSCIFQYFICFRLLSIIDLNGGRKYIIPLSFRRCKHLPFSLLKNASVNFKIFVGLGGCKKILLYPLLQKGINFSFDVLYKSLLFPHHILRDFSPSRDVLNQLGTTQLSW